MSGPGSARYRDEAPDGFGIGDRCAAEFLDNHVGNIIYWLPVAGYQLPVTSCWLLVAGWLLVR
jgi:hypothetical protein